MKVLLIGGGGREHALAWGLAQSRNCRELYCAPGNAGIADFAECIDIAADNVNALVDLAVEKAVNLVVVGPEDPLVAGIADRLKEKNIDVFGPSQAAARLEGSKGFMKDLCKKYDIPTAAYGRFRDVDSAKEFIHRLSTPIVVKADGLAAGKGVIIAQNVEEAVKAAKDMLSGDSFGDAGREVVIEQFMDGEELSYFALADGKTMLPLASAQDHKRVGEGDTGLNTGGMGAYSPAHLMSAELEEKILHRIIKPTIDAMAAEGCPFTGVLYAGLMIVKNEPYLIEYNVRFGDPECQTLIPRLQGDLLEILLASAQGRLDDIKGQVTWSHHVSMCVVMATQGYPGDYPKNTVIEGLDEAGQVDGVTIFHAGTKENDARQVVSCGGRVLGVTALGENIGHAKRLAYDAVNLIDWPEGFCRRDIGWRAVKARERAA